MTQKSDDAGNVTRRGIALLPILAVVGSRMGFALSIIAFAASLFIVARKNSRIRLLAARYRTYLIAAGGAVLVMLLALGAQVSSAVSGATTVSSSEIRFTIWQASWDVLKTYFPAGAGFGSFADVYKAGEPLATLEPSYINHAHNDFIEIVMDGGVPALALLVAGLAIFLVRLVRVVMAYDGKDGGLALAGGVIMSVLILASASDYPLRVPSIAAMMAIASMWLFAERQDKPSG